MECDMKLVTFAAAALAATSVLAATADYEHVRAN